jgi:hypothetical protein
MWEPQPLTTLRASKACRGENFTFTKEHHAVKSNNSHLPLKRGGEKDAEHIVSKPKSKQTLDTN